ncbi:hypothetical protein EYC59_02270 [Candidatus Saccharibacteria bacterium]|nr:MAG: hypothetical protein EYC59_02270 [Candidatus Saccharibacteria bacterium]
MEKPRKPALANRSLRPGRRLVASTAAAALLLTGCAAPRVGAESQVPSTKPTAEQSTDNGSLTEAEILAQRYVCTIESVEDTRQQPGPEVNIPNPQDATTVNVTLAVSMTERAKQLLLNYNGSVPAQLLTPSSIGANMVSLTNPKENSDPIPLYGDDILAPDTAEGTLNFTLYPPANVYRAGNQVVEISAHTRVTTSTSAMQAMDTEVTTTCGALESGPLGYREVQEDYTPPPNTIAQFEHTAG